MNDLPQISDSQITSWTDDLRTRAMKDPSRRLIAGIAGIPGSGKSTLAQRFVETLNLTDPHSSRHLPMDGFHKPNAQLESEGLLDRKGSPVTYDVDRFTATLRSAKQRESFTFPVYDRTLHEPVESNNPSQRLDSATSIVIVEGNYLLLDQAPWRDISRMLDISFFIESPFEQAHRWLLQRHTSGGRDVVAAEEHYQRTDFPNSRLVSDCLISPDYRIRW